MKPISAEQIYSLQKARQYFHDCYLVSSVNALTRSEKGRQTLQRNILTDGENFHVRFNKVKGEARDFFVSEQDRNCLVLVDKYANPVKLEEPHNPIIKAIEVAMNRIVANYPDRKPFICRLIRCNENFEYNKPSNFLEMFTGQKPFVLNEGSLQNSLKKRQEEATELFYRLDKSNEYSFVAGTGLWCTEGLTDLHCYTISGVNFENRYLEIIDNRLKETVTLGFDKAVKGLKFFTGFFN